MGAIALFLNREDAKQGGEESDLTLGDRSFFEPRRRDRRDSGTPVG